MNFLLDTFFVVFIKDTYMEKAPSNKTPALTEKEEYGHLGHWYIKSTLYKRFLN